MTANIIMYPDALKTGDRMPYHPKAAFRTVARTVVSDDGAVVVVHWREAAGPTTYKANAVVEVLA